MHPPGYLHISGNRGIQIGLHGQLLMGGNHYIIMSIVRNLGLPVLVAALIVMPSSVSAFVEYGAFYATPAPYSQLYYQPMYAYAATPVLNKYQQGSGYGYGSYTNYDTNPSYYSYANNQYLPQYGNYSASYPQYNYAYPQQYNNPFATYAPYGQNVSQFGQPVPYNYGYPTGDTMPWIGGQMCVFPDYEGRALCGSNPSQKVYDYWTGTWY
jgi:hypothetical protein